MHPDTEQPETIAFLPDELLGDEIAGQIPPTGDVAEEEEEEEEEDELPEDVSKALKSMIDDFARVEQPTRERMIRYWKKLELFWKGIQNIYWDYTARDYRRLDGGASKDYNDVGYEPNEDLDYYYQDKIINIYRSHGESVISALSQDVPTVIFPPDDAEVIEDVQTSKGYTKAAELLQKSNNAHFLLIHCIYILWNQGVVGAYNYNVQDEEFGFHLEPKYEDEVISEDILSCPNCGADMEPEQTICVSCEMEVTPIATDNVTYTKSVYVGDEEVPKRREKIELYGPLHFRVPHYVTNARHTPYVWLDTECHVDYARELFPDCEIGEESDLERYDRWARTSTDYAGDTSQGIVTISRVWLRPWTFNRFKKNEKEIYTYLRETFPDGIKISLVNDKIVKATAEKLDDHWTFTESPLSSHIHAEPLGAPLIPIQEMRNELVVLKLQTIEYGIPETFADPAVLDFEAYNKHEAAPGGIYPAKPLAGQTLDQAFTTLKTATFPKEASEFQQSLDTDGQMLSGAMPSIYGGAMPSASKTAAEYQMSRNQALQRLQTTWKILSYFWAKVMDKSVRSFIDNLTQDEHFTKKQGGGFINVYIRRDEMRGRVGNAEPELAQTFPMSWMQKKDLLIQMMQLNNDYINQALFHPQNTGLLAEYLGLRDFHIPGDDSRTKQLLEIQELLQSEPMEMMPPDPMEGELPPMEQGMMQPTMQSSVQVDELLDEHEVELDTCLTWLRSDIGQEAKISNPAGWMNVRQHAEEHNFYHQQQLMAEQQAMAEEEGKNKDNKDKGQPNPENQGEE
jgi:hypothetical protein